MDGIVRNKKPAKGKTDPGKARKKSRSAKPKVTMAEGVSASQAGAYLNDAIESMTGGFALFDADDRLVICNTRFRDQHPVISESSVPGTLFEDMVKSYARAGLYDGARKAQKEIIKKRLQLHRNTPSSHELQMLDGRWIEIRESKTHDGGTVLLWTNITDRKRAEGLQKGRGKVLERLATGGSLKEVLSLLVVSLEEVTPDMLGSVLVLDDRGKRLRTGAAPSLPDFYNKAVDGTRIGPKVGSCGAAAFSGKAVIVEDIMTHPNWKGFKKTAARAGLGACWSQPIISASGDVLGTFAMYHREPKKPTEQSLELIENTAHLAGIAIEHKRMEQAFRDSEERLRAIIEYAPGAIVIKDLKGRIENVNKTYCDWYGMKLEALTGKQGGDFFDGKTAKTIAAHEQEVAKNLQVIEEDRRVTYPAGGTKDVRSQKFPIFGPDGTCIAVGTVVNDITEHKRAEAVNTRLGRIIEQSLNEIFMFDAKTLQFVQVNHGARQNLGYTMAELKKFTPVDIKPDYTKRKFEKAIKPLRDGTQEQLVFETVHQRKDGSTYDVLVQLQLMQQETPAVFVAYIQDITELVQVGEERRLALASAEEASRVKSEFLATVSHELRTPLNAILGFAEIISGQILGTIEKPKYIEYANDIHTSGKYLLELVNDILDISTIEAGRRPLSKEKLSISKTISECVKSIAARAGENGITLSTQVPKNLPAIHADNRAIKQVLINLLSNAVKFTPPGGMITVQAEAANGSVTIKVSDTGPGIPEDEISNLMAPFAKGDLDPYVAQEGAGLGLAISDSLIKLHNGELEIKSPPGQGTTVSITLLQGTP